MKKFSTLLLFTILVTSLYSQTISQFPREINRVMNNKIHLIEIQDGVFKYISVEPTQFVLYNLNHSVYKTITAKSGVRTSYSKRTLLYVTTELFDCDPNTVEFLITSDQYSGGIYNDIHVFRENGDTLFALDIASLGYYENTRFFTYPAIVETPIGTKMVVYKHTLSASGPERFQVYALCGNLPTSLKSNGSSLTASPSFAYPNPTRSSVTIEYSLDEGETGVIQLMDSNGALLKEYSVDSSFENILLNLEEENLSSGVYYYSITSSSGARETNKILKID